MSHQVHVDADEVQEQLEQMADTAAADEQAAVEAQEQATSDPESWSKGASMVVAIIDAKVCPAWGLSRDEKAELSGALCKVLDHYFPGGLFGIERWHPLLQLAWVFGSIALTRFDFEQLQFEPMHRETNDADGEAQERRAGADRGGESEREDG